MWRFDARRGNASPDALPTELTLQWSRALPRLESTWPDQQKLDYGHVYEPIVVGQRVYVASSLTDDVVAYDTRSGQELWRFVTGGPVRLPPAAATGRLYVGSDDGYLYCLEAASGAVHWKFRGGPTDRLVFGNGRLISMWPVRGAPVVDEDTVYFAAGIWPFMGVFIHALDAETGEVRWTNDGEGARFMKQPHNSDSFAGVAPQGPLVVSGDVLLIPGGRSLPAAFDRRTGRLLHYELAANGKRGGGFEVAATDKLFFNGNQAFELASGQWVGPLGGPLAIGRDRVYGHNLGGDELQAFDLAKSTIEDVVAKDAKGNETRFKRWSPSKLWTLSAPRGEAFMLAGNRLYDSGPNEVRAIELPAPFRPAHVVWRTAIDGTPARMIAADDRLFVTTDEGELLCFGGNPTDTPTIHELAAIGDDAEQAAGEAALSLLAAETPKAGIGVVWGYGDGRLVTDLLRATELHVIVVEPDSERVAAARAELRAAGLYGKRAAVLQGSPRDFPLPQYLASLMIVAEPAQLAGLSASDGIARLFAKLRPFDGVLAIRIGDDVQNGGLSGASAPSGARAARSGAWQLLRRTGPLPGSANWTHEHGDAANTRVSRDQLVKAPLGLLWFGGPSHEGVLPRHGHGPQPQVLDGRVIIEGVDMLRAVDAYTGRLLWQRDLPSVGAFFDQLAHQPGANATGTNFVSTPDGIFVAYRDRCLRLAPETGETAQEYRLPPQVDGSAVGWGYINVADGLLIGGGNPLITETDDNQAPKPGKNDNLSGSKTLHVLETTTGKELWRAAAENHFRHNAICVGGGRLYAVDLLSQAEQERLKRRGQSPPAPSQVVAFDLRTGEVLWRTSNDVFGTWLSYSAEHDVLVESGRVARDSLGDEPQGMRAFRAATGDVLWRNDRPGPAMLHGDQVLAGQSACWLLTGEPVLRDDPLTGNPVEWTWTRNYGCNTPLASENLIMFRSGAAGYYDLACDGGTGNFGGFRSGCTNNLIVAAGLVSAPDYTRTCVCNYQNQTSLALVHMPDVETWTEFDLKSDGRLQRLALNLGAPGDRRAADGQLWLNECPQVQVEYEGADAGPYHRHASQIVEGEPAWVAASGCKGVRRITVDLGSATPASGGDVFTMRLHFCEPEFDDVGRRIMTIRANGRAIVEALDVVERTGGRNRALIVESPEIEAGKTLVLEFDAVDSEGQAVPAVLTGVEITRTEPGG